MTAKEFEAWLQTVPDDEVVGFEEKAHLFAEKYAEENDDITAESCLKSFFGDNPKAWLTEAFDSIIANCKTKDQAAGLLKKLYDEVMNEVAVRG